MSDKYVMLEIIGEKIRCDAKKHDYHYFYEIHSIFYSTGSFAW